MHSNFLLSRLGWEVLGSRVFSCGLALNNLKLKIDLFPEMAERETQPFFSGFPTGFAPHFSVITTSEFIWTFCELVFLLLVFKMRNVETCSDAWWVSEQGKADLTIRGLGHSPCP